MLPDRDVERRRSWRVDVYEADWPILVERARIDGYAGRVSLWVEGVIHLLGQRPDIRLPFPPHPRLAVHQHPGRLRRRFGGRVRGDVLEEVIRAIAGSEPPLTSIQQIRRVVRRGLAAVNRAVNELQASGQVVKVGRSYVAERRQADRRAA